MNQSEAKSRRAPINARAPNSCNLHKCGAVASQAETNDQPRRRLETHNKPKYTLFPNCSRAYINVFPRLSLFVSTSPLTLLAMEHYDGQSFPTYIYLHPSECAQSTISAQTGCDVGSNGNWNVSEKIEPDLPTEFLPYIDHMERHHSSRYLRTSGIIHAAQDGLPLQLCSNYPRANSFPHSLPSNDSWPVLWHEVALTLEAS